MSSVRTVSVFLLCVSTSVVHSACCKCVDGIDGEDGTPGDPGLQGEPGIQGEQGEAGPSFSVILPDDTDDLSAAVDMLPDSGGTIFLRAQEGCYEVIESVHIDRSNVTIQGEAGVEVCLADGVDQPLILIGSDAEVPSESERVENIRLIDLALDGNRENQSSETDPSRPWLRNNLIDIRMASRVWVDRVDSHSGISGCLVGSWSSELLHVDDSLFHDCFYDGIALYTSSNLVLRGFQAFDNGSAGISLDNDLSDVLFADGLVRDNGDVGIFVRDSQDLGFRGLSVRDNASYAVFAADAGVDGTEVSNLSFMGCDFTDNGGGFWQASSSVSSDGNVLMGSVFRGTGAEILDSSGLLVQSGNLLL